MNINLREKLSMKMFSKLPHYLSIFTIIFGATLGSMNSAFAADQTITVAADDYDSTMATATDGADIILDPADEAAGTVLTVAIAAAADVVSDWKMNADGAGTATLKIANTGAITLAGTFDANSGKHGTMAVEFATADTAPSLVTWSGAIASTGTSALTVGSATTAGNISFTNTAAMVVDTVTVTGGDHADEDSTVTFTDAVTSTSISLDDNTGVAKAVFSVTGTDTVAGTIDGGAAGEGTVQVTGATKTFSGIIGGTNSIGTLDVDNTAVFSANVSATNILIADGKTATFNGVATTGAITLGSSTAGGTMAFAHSAAQTVTGSLASFGTDKKGTITSNNSHAGGVTITGDVGTADASIALLTSTQNTTVNGAIYSEAITVANAHGLTAKGNIEVGAGDLILSGTTGDLTLSGTSAQTVSGTGATALISGGGSGQGRIIVSNAAGATLDIVAGSGSNLELVSLTTSGTGHVLLTKAGHKINDLVIGSGTTFELTTDVGTGTDVITTSSVGDTFNSGSTVIMPSNIGNGNSITLIANDDNANVDEIAEDVNTALQDTALTDFVATVNVGDLNVTSTDRSPTAAAAQLGVTTNDATALAQLRNSMVAGSATELAAINNTLNATNSFLATEDTTLARQASPQTDLISGSSVAAQGVTGSVQGIISNRMASLRSGDAYFGTGVAAGGMSAQSGFIQVFGSTAEQESTKVGSGTQAGFDTDTQGVAIGFDGVTDAGMTVGVSVSTANTDVDGKGTGKSTNSIDTYSASLYMDTATENGYFEGSLTFGVNENSTSRKVTSAGLNRTYTGSYDSNNISLNLGAGVPTEVGVGYLTPFGSFTATVMDIDAYTEKSTVADDALRLKVAQDDVNSMVGTVGLKFHGEMSNGGIPMISLAINNEFGDDTIQSTNTYQGGGTAFKTTTAVEELSATLGLGYSYGTDATSIEFAYEADANDDDYLSHYGSIKIVGKF
jgi:uncharacterized protein with beta-barrel porin domain